MNYTLRLLIINWLFYAGCVAMDQPQAKSLDCGDLQASVYINDTTFVVGGTKRSILFDLSSQQIEGLIPYPTYSIKKHPLSEKIALLSTCSLFGSTIITFYDHATRQGSNFRMPVYIPHASIDFIPHEEASLMFYNPVEGFTVINFGKDKGVTGYTFSRLHNNTQGIFVHKWNNNQLICSNNNQLIIMQRLGNKVMPCNTLPLAHVCRDIVSLMSSFDDSCLAILATSLKSSTLQLYMYYKEYNQIKCFGRCRGMQFHPNNKDIAILRPHNVIEYWDCVVKSSTAKTLVNSKFSDTKDTEAFYPLSFSPHGDFLLVQIYSTLYRVAVPAMLYADYKKRKNNRQK